MRVYRAGEFAIRNSNGERVRIIDAIPNGMRIIYHVEDCQSGYGRIVQAEDLRPDTTTKGDK